jgi:uncharacterized membrane protein
MVTGPLRGVLWILGSLAVIWLVLGLAAIPSMSRMMGAGGMTGGGMMDGGMMQGGMMGGMMPMMGMMLAQVVAMLGLVGVFVYLAVDTLRRRRSLR